MKYCGCQSCKANGEINLHEEFEAFYEAREIEAQYDFEKILSDEFSAQELEDFELEFAGQHLTDVVNRINEAAPFNAQDYWTSYGGSLNGFKELRENQS
jgi:hypothetical protein